MGSNVTLRVYVLDVAPVQSTRTMAVGRRIIGYDRDRVIGTIWC
jgi:hypothetical protein